MKRINLKIKTKIMLMNMGILVPIIFFIYIITINNLHSNVVKSSVEFLKQESYNTQLYIANYLENDKEMDVERNFINKSPLIATYLSNKLRLRIQMFDKTGAILADSVMNSVSLYDQDINNALRGDKAYIIKKIDGKIYILFSNPIYSNNNTIGCVRYVYTVDNGEKIINNMLYIMGIIALLAVLISLILSNIFSESIAEPIKNLKYASEKLAAGEYENKINIKSGDEIEDLAETFNIMSESIKKYIESIKQEKQKQKDFLDNVTHEFKTPLTAIIGYSDLIPKLKDKEDINESLEYIKKEGERLLKLVEELLYLSKLGKTEFIINRTSCNIKQVIEEALALVQLRIEKYDIEIVRELIDVDLLIDKDKTKQVILNILDNAIKYSECTRIIVRIERQNTNTIVSIIDNGIGIDKQHIDNLFQPIYIFNKIKSTDKNGNGLGLSICQEIMKKQEGSIEILSDNKKGTEVKLIFKNS